MARGQYSTHTAAKIRACVKANPGIKAKEIGTILGLKKHTVNSYLYSSQPGALRNEVYQDSNYGWHLKTATVPQSQQASSHQKIYSAIPSYQPNQSSPSFPDRYISVQVSLQEAFHGTCKILHSDDGIIEVNIPPKTRPGTRLLVREKVSSDGLSEHRGRLYCWVNPIPDDPMILAGNDVVYRASIDSTLASNGGEIEVPTVQGRANVKVPAGVQSHSKLRLREQGWPLPSGGRGDQYIHLEIEDSSPAFIVSPPTKEYSPEVIGEVFRSEDYVILSDDEQGKLADMLEKAELARQQQQAIATAQKAHPLAVLSSGWFWLALLVGGMVIYGVPRWAPQLLPSPSTPVEQPAQ
jgi:hypothetical protein